MAAPAVPLRGSGPPLCPSFAEVCSFLERYGPALDLPEMTFPQMERYLRDTTAVPKPLVELHVKLLRKLGRSVTTDRWEKYLAKVCQELNSTWAWELERKGYQEMSMECKASILKYLCECQFDDNLKFKMVVNDEDPEKMRLQPVGRDRQGLMYWLQLDQDQNIRLYTEEQDDQDGSSWTCIVRTRNDLAEALELLKAQIDPNHSQDQDQNQNQDQDQNQNQAGSRSSSPTQKETGSEAVGSRDPEASKAAEQNTDSQKVESVKEEKPLISVLKQEVSEAVKEECVPPKPSVIDNRVSTITAVIKSEPRDAADAPRNAVSVVMAPGSAVMKQEASREEEERAVVRSNQQAKIPLKKRELKLAESFHSNHLSSSIIVCNPAVIQSTDGKPPGSLAPPGGPTASQQLVASRQELTNGRTSLLLPHKDGHNGVIGVIGQVGVIGHIGVIQRTSEQQELNGPILDLRSCRAADEEREASRQSVLVRKGLSDPPAATDTSRKTLKHDQKPEAPDRTGEAGSSQSTEETRRPEPEDQEKTTEEQGDEEKRSPQQDEGGGDEASRQPATGGGRKGNEEEDKMEEEPGDAATPLEEQKEKKEKEEQKEQEEKEKKDQKDQEQKEKNQNQNQKNQKEQREQREQRQKELQAGGVNGALAAQVRLKDIGSEGRKGPLEEASSELQKEGIRLKIKIPPHRRNKLKKGGKEEEKERQQEAQEEGRPLRRSARICRPSSKAAESQRKKPPRKPTQPTRRREEEEEDEEDEEEEEEQSPATKKDGKAGAVGPTRKRRGKRRHRRPRWSNVRTKRRKPNEDEDRGRRRGEEDSDGGSESEDDSCKSEEVPSEDACTHCGLPNHPELILLCDSCDSGFHTACLRPPLMLIPDGEWFCPPCQHKLLCEKLEEQLLNLDSALKKKERAERRRERLVYVGISVENIIPEGDEEEEEEQKSAKKKDSKKSKNLGRRSTRTRKHISYRFDDFDDAIDEAIEEDFRDLCGGTGRGTDITAILSEDGKETQRPIRSQTHTARSRRRRRLNDLESDSTAAESEDEFLISNSSEDEDFGASAADDDDEEDEDGGSDVGSWESGTRPRRAMKAGPKHKPNRTQQRGRKRPRRRRRRSSEEEEEDSEEDMDSDQFSDMTDSDADKKRRGLRRGQRQQVNYRETSESSDNSRTSAPKERPKARGRPRKERLSSDYSDASPSSKDSEEEDYDDEEEDEQRRRVYRRRRDEEDERRNRTRGKRRYEDEEDEGEGGQRMKRRPSEEEERRRRRMKRTDQEEEEPQRMGRGRRREMLTQQRRRRLAMMLKKRRPSTDEDESDESESSSEEDRPVRKRLNRIDSDDDEEEDEEEEGRQRSRKCSERKADSDTQEKGRGQSPPPHGHRSSRGPERPGDREGQGRHNGPLEEEEEEQEEEEQEEEQTDRVDSALKALQS